MKKKSAAILTVYDISKMTNSGREDILKWLQTQIRYIRKYHKNPGFASRFTARYIYEDAKSAKELKAMAKKLLK